MSGDGGLVAVGQSDGGFCVLELRSTDGADVAFENAYAYETLRKGPAVTAVRFSRDGARPAMRPRRARPAM